MEPLPHFFHTVLFQPEIPENTGAIGRTCVGVGAKLWLVRPLGFQVDQRRLKRAGLDYWPNLKWEIVDDWDHLLDRIAEENGVAPSETRGFTRPLPDRFWFMTKRGVANYTQVRLRRGDVFVFGAESTGLPKEILETHSERCLKIPIQPGIRCLNLSVSVGITLFEARRQVYEA
ncbi:MAG: tRNA (cytidine(34)-2'-O)-methyltransferase [Thermoguttaceae bacterium]